MSIPRRSGLIMAAVLVSAMSCASMKEPGSFMGPTLDESEAPATVTASIAEEAGKIDSGERNSRALGPADPLAGGKDTHETKRIVTTSVEMEVESFDASMDEIKKIAKASGGHVSTSSSRKDDEGRLSGSVELRIPAERYEAVLKNISGLGDVRDMSETSQDVTEEYVDLEARLANARRLETRILELLETKTGSIEDVLSVEKELASVREQIERLEGRLRFLDDRVGMSTITVNLYEKGARWGGEPTAGQVFGQILEKIGIVFVGSVGILITFVVAVAPWALTALVVVLVIVAIVRARRRRKAKAS